MVLEQPPGVVLVPRHLVVELVLLTNRVELDTMPDLINALHLALCQRSDVCVWNGGRALGCERPTQ